MEINLERVNDAFLMRAENERGYTIELDGAEKIGGGDAGFRPMELMLVALGSCSAIDIISILKKQRQELKNIKVKVNGEREAGAVPALFTRISVKFTVSGELVEKKVAEAVELSMTKYCSAAKTLEQTAQIDYSFEIV